MKIATELTVYYWCSFLRLLRALSDENLFRGTLKAYRWYSSFLQSQERKHKCSYSHRQYMFLCFYKGLDNNH